MELILISLTLLFVLLFAGFCMYMNQTNGHIQRIRGGYLGRCRDLEKRLNILSERQLASCEAISVVLVENSESLDTLDTQIQGLIDRMENLSARMGREYTSVQSQLQDMIEISEGANLEYLKRFDELTETTEDHDRCINAHAEIIDDLLECNEEIQNALFEDERGEPDWTNHGVSHNEIRDLIEALPDVEFEVPDDDYHDDAAPAPALPSGWEYNFAEMGHQDGFEVVVIEETPVGGLGAYNHELRL